LSALKSKFGLERVAPERLVRCRHTGASPSVTLELVPTTRPRHPVTETDEIAEILDDAARKWPEVPRARLIQLVIADWAAGGRSPSARSAARKELVGSLPGSAELYDANADWPE